MSPEVLNPQQSKYSGKLSDSWSLGIVLFTMLLGRYPFHHQAITTMFAKIARGKFQIPPSSCLSLDAKILLRSLIRLKPEERLLPSEILACNWLKPTEIDYNQLQQNKFKNLNSACQYLQNLNSTSNVPIANNVCFHKPLGISRSAPFANTATSPYFNQKSVSSNNIGTNNSNDNDRAVPECN